MELNDYVAAVVQQMRMKRFEASPQLSLGKLISEIERAGIHKDDDKPKDIRFDFGSAEPTTLASWRGSYAELALGYKLTGYDAKNDSEHFSQAKSDELLAGLKSAIGQTYGGWKGGDFTMDENTPVWVANQGNSGNTGIVGVLDIGYCLVILTAYCEY